MKNQSEVAERWNKGGRPREGCSVSRGWEEDPPTPGLLGHLENSLLPTTLRMASCWKGGFKAGCWRNWIFLQAQESDLIQLVVWGWSGVLEGKGLDPVPIELPPAAS